MRKFIKEATPEVHVAIQALVDAVDAHIASNFDLAAAKFRQANCPITWEWLNPAWINVEKNVIVPRPHNDTQAVSKSERDIDRNIAAPIKKSVLQRDGYKCRYCDLPVIHADIRKIAHQLYPIDVPWNSRNPAEQHSGFQVTWLQFDHVIPHSHGGRSSMDNVVVSCALCNFGKDRFTLKQLNVESPFMRDPIPSEFDGLERLRPFRPKPLNKAKKKNNTFSQNNATTIAPSLRSEYSDPESFFFAGAYVRSGYVYVPPIAGKSRWFEVGLLVQAEMTERSGVQGCIVHCPREMIVRRGLDAEALLDGSTRHSK